MGQRIASHGIAAEPVFHQAPLFPALLAATYTLVGPAASPIAVLLLQAILSSAAVALLVLLAEQYLGSALAGVAGAGLVILHGPFVFHSLKLLPVPLTLAAWGCALAALGAARRNESRAREGLAGLLLGIVALARTEALLFAPVGAAVLALGGPARSRRSRIASILVFAAGLAAGVAPATIHNLRRGDTVLVASSGGENLFIGNQRGARGDYTAIHPQAGDLFSERVLARMLAEKDAGRELLPSQVSSFWRGRAIREVLADPWGWLAVEGRKIGRILDPGDPTDAYSFPLERNLYLPWLHALALPAWPLLVLGLAGIVLALRTRRAACWPLACAAAVQIATLLTFFVNTRLRLPLLFLLAPFGGFALVEAFRRRRDRDVRFAFAVGAPLLAALAVTGALLTRPTPRDHVRLAAVLSSRGRLDDGLAALAPVLAASPPYGLALDQAGWILHKKGDFNAAGDRYRAAIAAGLPTGRTAMTRSRLAMVLERSGAPAEAAAEHDRAVASPDAIAGTWYERGMFRMRRGDGAGARSDLLTAERLDPAWDLPREALARIGN